MTHSSCGFFGGWVPEEMKTCQCLFFPLTSLHNTLFCCIDTLVHQSVAPLCARLCVLPDLLYHRGNGLWQKLCHGMPAAVSNVLCTTKEDENTHDMDRDWNESKGEKWKSGHVLFQQSDDSQVMFVSVEEHWKHHVVHGLARSWETKLRKSSGGWFQPLHNS